MHPNVRLVKAFGSGKALYCNACRGSVTSERKAAAVRANGLLGGLPLTLKRCGCGRRLGITNRSGVCRLCQRQPKTAPRSVRPLLRQLRGSKPKPAPPTPNLRAAHATHQTRAKPL